jgi:hypothetical protein
MNTKKCNTCLIVKTFVDFHVNKSNNDGYNSICKECRKITSKKYYKDNKEQINEKSSKKYYKDHENNLIKDRERIKNEREVRKYRSKIYYQNNKDKVKVYKKKHYVINKEKYIEKSLKWCENNKEKCKEVKSVRTQIRKKEDVLFRLKIKLKTDIYKSLKKNKRSKKIEEIIGLSLLEYKKYIENQFEEWMSWDNWGLRTWHIDHIIPLSSAKTEEEIYKLWDYKNLRPLSAKENLIKSNKF